MRVGLLHPVYWPEVRRGGERMVRELADGLAARGHTARIVTTHRARTARAVEDGVEVLRAWRPPDGRLDRRLYEDHAGAIVPTALALRREPRRDDALIALHATSAAAAARWSAGTGQPFVYAYTGIPAVPWLAARRGRLALIERALESAAAVTVLSEAAAAAMERWLGVTPRVIAPGVDLAAFAPLGDRTPAPTVLCAADAREPRKRVGLLVTAMALVRRERPDARLVLDRATAGAFAAEPGVELAAMDDRAALASLASRAWVAALPSVGEAFGLVLAEALAAGTPVVGADEGGIGEVVGRDGAVGRLFAGEDPAALARALVEAIGLAEGGGEALRAACRARAERFSAARTAAAYEALLVEVGA